jgi:ribosome biogenesis GTPase A
MVDGVGGAVYVGHLIGGFVFKPISFSSTLLRSVITNVGEKEISVLLSYVNPDLPTNHGREPAGFDSLPPRSSSSLTTLNTFEKNPLSSPHDTTQERKKQRQQEGMPRNQGTSRKGKPGKQDRALGFGRTLQKATTSTAYVKPKSNGKSRSGDGGMQPSLPTSTDNIAHHRDLNTTKSVLELASVDDFLFQAELANAQFVSERYHGGGGGGGSARNEGGGGGVVVIDPTCAPYKPPVVQFASDNPSAEGNHNSSAAAATRDGDTSGFVFRELSVPRRPQWDRSTTPQELEEREQLAFLNWRRSIAMHEEALLSRQLAQQQQQTLSNTNRAPNISVTPFEKNLQVWRQLWRVLERSKCVLLLVDARNPLFYLSDDLRDYCTNDLQTPMMVVVNKSDYLTPTQRQAWKMYLKQKGWDGICFFSAYEEQQKLDKQAQIERRNLDHDEEEDVDAALDPQDDSEDEDEEDSNENVENNAGEDEHKESDNANEGASRNDEVDDVEDDDCPPLLSRQQLVDAMLEFADQHGCEPDPRYTTMDKSDPSLATNERIPFGLVGFPNVGKSSVINVLMGNSKHTHGTVKVGVASQPGKTKHFQTLLLPGETSKVVLCDCPGLVFPSFVSNTADLIASGVYPIAQMRDPYPVMSLICQRIPRNILNATYGIHLPEPLVLPSTHGRPHPPPTAEELLDTYCVARSMLSASSGVPDVHRASRQIIHDYATGKLLYCHAPPSLKLSSASAAADGIGQYDDTQLPRCTLTDEEYQQETLRNALRRTDKLRDKLLRQEEPAPGNHGGRDDDDDSGSADDADSATAGGDDDQLLEFLRANDDDGATSSASGPPTSHKKHFKKKGKKGTKADRGGRDPDPYGCHDTPDDVLAHQAAVAATTALRGVGVKAGKYSRDAGYTRPSYSGARGAAAPTSPPSTIS